MIKSPHAVKRSRLIRRILRASGRGLKVLYECRLKQLRLESDLLNTKIVEKIAQLAHTKRQLSDRQSEAISALARKHSLPDTSVEQIFRKLGEVSLRE